MSGDYASASGDLTFAPGGPLSQTVTVLVNGDTTIEPDEAFTVVLSAPAGATLGDDQGTGAVANDDANHPPVLAPIADAFVLVGNVLVVPLSATDQDHDSLVFG